LQQTTCLTYRFNGMSNLSAIMSAFVRLGGGTGRVGRVELKMFERLTHNPLQLVETARAALESYLREHVHPIQPKETPDA
jgi:hypothetical protein